MSENIVPFPKLPGTETPDELLAEASNRLESVVIIGWDNDGDFFWRSTANTADINWMLDVLKNELLTPEIGVVLDD